MMKPDVQLDLFRVGWSAHSLELAAHVAAYSETPIAAAGRLETVDTAIDALERDIARLRARLEALRSRGESPWPIPQLDLDDVPF